MDGLEKEIVNAIIKAGQDRDFALSIVRSLRTDSDKKLYLEFLKQRPKASDRSMLLGVMLLSKRRRENSAEAYEEEW